MTREAHPVADLFPMLAPDELAEMAADIKERGLLQPIVLDAEGRILDGRNRLAACEMAGVEPDFTTYDGDDPDGYALAVNGQRRATTKTQKAIVAAAYLINSSKLEEFGEAARVARALGANETRVYEAVQVLRFAPDEAAKVVAGQSTFSHAHDIAKARRREAEEVQAKRDRLNVGAPDLADRVDEGMDLDEALAAMEARERKAAEEAERERLAEEARRTEEQQRAIAEAAQRESERRAAIANLRSVLTFLVSSSVPPEVLAENDYGAVLDEFKEDELRFAAAAMAALVEMKENA